jgi:hypothetical protein
VHATDALSHSCDVWWNTKSIREGIFNRCAQEQCTDGPNFRFSEVASAIARRLILDCGMNPENTTLTEMNSEIHPFVVHKNDKLVARNWEEMVSCVGSVTVYSLG